MNLYGLTKKELEDYFESKNEKKFKATQVYEWLYQKKIKEIDEMSNLKKEVRENLKKDFSLCLPKILLRETDTDVEKYLFELEDHEKVEAVLMHHSYGLSLCISTQVGCNMGCAFCESGRLKKIRNLKTHEMVGQILAVEEEGHIKISSVVLMGIGEPFDNYDNVMNFITVINDSKGLQIGARHITVSTCGMVPKIKEFMNFPLQVNLAWSMHAPNDSLREKLMPINRSYPIHEVLEVLKEYIKKTNRRVTIEYILLKDVNDTEECAKEMIQLIKGMNVYVNLIPYNETNHIEFQKSDKKRIDKFYDTLKKNHINVTVRREFGSKIAAACGQLRSKEI